MKSAACRNGTRDGRGVFAGGTDLAGDLSAFRFGAVSVKAYAV